MSALSESLKTSLPKGRESNEELKSGVCRRQRWRDSAQGCIPRDETADRALRGAQDFPGVRPDHRHPNAWRTIVYPHDAGRAAWEVANIAVAVSGH